MNETHRYNRCHKHRIKQILPTQANKRTIFNTGQHLELDTQHLASRFGSVVCK